MSVAVVVSVVVLVIVCVVGFSCGWELVPTVVVC